MKLNFKLDFLYYQKVMGLDDIEDKQLDAYRKDIVHFEKFLRTESIPASVRIFSSTNLQLAVGG